MIRFDIFSDPICPWCYIGKVRLDAAFALNPGLGFDIHWHPFQLNPDMAQGGMDRREYLEGKFGGKTQAVQVYTQIDAAAKTSGLTLDFAGIKRTPNTLDAHRLIYWSGIEGCQNAVVDRMFKAYFQQGRDISVPSVLCGIASGAGMDKAVVAKVLEGDSDKDTMRAADAQAREMGIQGVPFFVVAEEHAISGAQETTVWDAAIKEILANR